MYIITNVNAIKFVVLLCSFVCVCVCLTFVSFFLHVAMFMFTFTASLDL